MGSRGHADRCRARGRPHGRLLARGGQARATARAARVSPRHDRDSRRVAGAGSPAGRRRGAPSPDPSRPRPVLPRRSRRSVGEEHREGGVVVPGIPGARADRGRRLADVRAPAGRRGRAGRDRGPARPRRGRRGGAVRGDPGQRVPAGEPRVPVL